MSYAFADPHTLLVTERNGRLRVIRDGVRLQNPVERDQPVWRVVRLNRE